MPFLQYVAHVMQHFYDQFDQKYIKKVILHVEESNLGYNRNLPLYYYNTAVWTNLKFLV